MQTRRTFLKSSLGIVAAVLAQAYPLKVLGNDFWSRPRYLWMLRADTGEQVKVCYSMDGQLQLDGYVKACQLLRDTHENKAVRMNPVLLDILCGTQGWLSYYGIVQPIIIDSGYRTRSTNYHTEGAAKNSMHLRGAAADIRMHGVSSLYMAELAVYLNGGGVGFYPKKHFTHVDCGKLRTWQG